MLRRNNRSDRVLNFNPFVKWAPKTTPYQNYFKEFHLLTFTLWWTELPPLFWKRFLPGSKEERRLFWSLVHMFSQSLAEIQGRTTALLVLTAGEEPPKHLLYHIATQIKLGGNGHEKRAEFCLPIPHRSSEHCRAFKEPSKFGHMDNSTFKAQGFEVKLSQICI